MSAQIGLFGMAGCRMDAVVSDCGTYRYTLNREWARGIGGSVLWVMLNPSTADANKDDATIRKCIGFTQEWGLAGFTVVNLFALRSTDPRGLRKAKDPVGPLNRQILGDHIRGRHDRVVVAWGDGIKHAPRELAEEMVSLVDVLTADAMCLGFTRSGQPRHPLMLAYATKMQPWRAP